MPASQLAHRASPAQHARTPRRRALPTHRRSLRATPPHPNPPTPPPPRHLLPRPPPPHAAGDSFVTAPTLGDFYPEAQCDVLYLDGSPTHASVSADLRALTARAAPGALAVVAGARARSDARRAWADAARTGLVDWEGTTLENAAEPESSDALVWGRVRAQPAAAAAMLVEAEADAAARAVPASAIA